ncbi:hypothetical protein HN680_02015, partial [Candidatus Peregrinibacteria bacterium]|nr:hypothetical protein [Candidatus Peregrinibacteria bacterium]
MHVLILNHHPLQAKFLQKGFRYENIGSDFCHPDNLTKIWYNQYDALIVPIKTWEFPPIKSFLEILKSLGNVPIFITHQIPPPKNLAPSFAELPSLRLIGTHTPFLHLLQKLKN